jgi:protein gp37
VPPHGLGDKMAQKSEIEWTDATWNPSTGCTKVSSGCDNCYAHTLAHRLLSATYRSQLPVIDSRENRGDPFAVRIWPARLEVPATWKVPRRIFVNSMSDLFHKDVPDDFVVRCFEVMLSVDRHVYQILTKRPARAARFVSGPGGHLFMGGPLPPHIWIGTSVEDQSVDYRIRHLLDVPAEVRFLSCEPLLGPLDLSAFLGSARRRPGLEWVIVGGESGPHARPLHPDWARAVRDQCRAHEVPFFFKQWGGRTPKAGGRELDGRTWDEYPTADHHLVGVSP